jgi:uncharacterized membrane protein (UPF0127 family)
MTRTRRAVWLAAGALAVGAIVVALVAWQASDDGAADSSAVVTRLRDARSPFAGYTAGTIRVGGKKLRVVVADDEGERVQGLRQKSDASPYDGMLFVFPASGRTSFTMATVAAPLEIAFYDDRGRVIDRLHMVPCAGTDASCPAYRPSGDFVYALETANGDRYPGRLAVPRAS